MACRRAAAAATGATVAALALAGCGGGNGAVLTVFAASSLQEPLGRYAAQLPGTQVRDSFAGSDQLAAQLRAGLRPDVFASADTEFPWRLHREGLVGRPVAFARNRLVIAVRSESDVTSLRDLAKPGVSISIGEPQVPAGAYATTVLRRLPSAERRRILANVASREPDVETVIARVAAGGADAGFAYATDVIAAGGDLRAVPLPPRLQPDVTYAAAVVRGAPHPELARRYLDGLAHGRGAADLRAAGFLPPP